MQPPVILARGAAVRKEARSQFLTAVPSDGAHNRWDPVAPRAGPAASARWPSPPKIFRSIVDAIDQPRRISVGDNTVQASGEHDLL